MAVTSGTMSVATVGMQPVATRPGVGTAKPTYLAPSTPRGKAMVVTARGNLATGPSRTAAPPVGTTAAAKVATTGQLWPHY